MNTYLHTLASSCERRTMAYLRRGSAAFVALACACGSEATTPPAPGSALDSMAGASGQATMPSAVDPGAAGSGMTTTPARPDGITWAATPGPDAPELDLSIALGVGGWPLVNAAGDILTWGISFSVLDGTERRAPLMTRLNRDGEVSWSRGYASEASLSLRSRPMAACSWPVDSEDA